MKKRKFPQDVARFFNPLKSLVIEFDDRRKHKNMYQKGTHQYEKSKEISYVPVYMEGRTAKAFLNSKGVKSYKTINPKN